MRNKLLLACLFFSYVLFSQTFVRNYSNASTTYQLKMEFQEQSWGDVYLDVEVTNKGTSNLNIRNSKVIFLSDMKASLVNFFTNGKISYPTTVLNQILDGSQHINTLTIGLPNESWVDNTLGVNESFKFRIDLKTVTTSYVNIANSVQFFLENEEPSLFTDIITSISGNEINEVIVSFRNTVTNKISTEIITSSSTNSLKVDQKYNIWSKSFAKGTTKYVSQYTKESPLNFIPSKNNNTVVIPFTKEAIASSSLKVLVNGLPIGISTELSLKNNELEGVDKTQQIVNGNVNIPDVLVGSYTVNVATYSDTVNNLVYTPKHTASVAIVLGGNNVISINYESTSVHEFTVKGFPKYLSHGTITNASEAFDDNFKNSPLSVIFKYSGLDGAGDRGKIPDMTPTKNTIEQARRLEASQGGRVILPVMVHYTANASGGGSLEAIKDMEENQNLYYHYRNLIQEIKVILSYEDDKHPNPGAFVISPDLIGAIQQDVAFGNDHDIRTMLIKVNEEINKAFTDEGLSTQSIPVFTNNLKGYFQSINFLIYHVGECKIPFGYQQNVWAGGSARWVYEGAGEFNSPVDEAIEIATFMNELELYTGEWKPDFIAFDRYERDCFGPAAIQNYAWTARHWDKYLVFCKEISERIGNVPIMLWQIPGGHMATKSEVTTNYNVAQHSSAAAPYFLGDDRIGTNINKIKDELRNIPLTLTHYQASSIGEHLMNDNGYDWGTSNLQRLANMNVFSILWGGGSTTGVGSIGTNGDDDKWLANKIKAYYENPPVFKTTSIPVYSKGSFCSNINTGSEVKTNEFKVTLFPSPIEDYLQIKSSEIDDEIEIVIFDVFGTELNRFKKIENSILDVSNLLKGIYLVKIYSTRKEKSITKMIYKK